MTLNLKYDQKRIRKYHYFMLLSLIRKNKRLSRTQLAKLTRISNTSIGIIIKELIEDELVIEVGQTKGTVGRRATLLEINPKGSYIIGVGMESDSIQIAIVSLSGEIIESKCITYDVKNNAELVLDKIAEEIVIMINKVGSSIAEKVIAIGISIPGLVSWPEGNVLTVPQFQWKDIEVKAYLEERLDYVVYVDNDVRAVLLAESLFGNMVDIQDSACVYIGSGVGGAVMVNGEILRGHCNTLGEIGHMTLQPDGLLCDCGRRGCLQTFVCSSELEKQAEQSIHDIFAAFGRKEHWAVTLIHRARSYLSLAISNVICIYNPKAILLTGPMVQSFPVLIEGIEEEVNKHVWQPLKDSFQIRYSSIGKNGSVIGASALVLNEFLRYSNDEI